MLSLPAHLRPQVGSGAVLVIEVPQRNAAAPTRRMAASLFLTGSIENFRIVRGSVKGPFWS